MTDIDTTRPRAPDLGERRLAVMIRLDELRRAHGICLLDGKPFDRAPIEALEAELEAITAAEGEVSRRDRDAQTRAIEKRRAQMRRTLSKLEEQRLEAVERAEKAACELADAMNEAQRLGREVFVTVRELGFAPPRTLDACALEHRLSWRLTSVLKRMTGLRRVFGQIRFPDAQSRFNTPWRDAEAREAAPYLEQALEGTQE